MACLKFLQKGHVFGHGMVKLKNVGILCFPAKCSVQSAILGLETNLAQCGLIGKVYLLH